MASINPTTCPDCGGKAHWNTDDGVTYCENVKCGFQGCENLDYRPPAFRGGFYSAQELSALNK